jgi:hypothetical protein
MIRIAITAEAFDAIAKTLPLGTVAFEPSPDPSGTREGERFVWLAPAVINKLRFLRAPDESYSDVILRLAETAQ